MIKSEQMQQSQQPPSHLQQQQQLHKPPKLEHPPPSYLQQQQQQQLLKPQQLLHHQSQQQPQHQSQQLHSPHQHHQMGSAGPVAHPAFQPPPPGYPVMLPGGACFNPMAGLGLPPGPHVQPRRKNATRETTMVLKHWLSSHKRNPYPTKNEKVFLAVITCMTLTQVSTWFANARRRLKKENKMTWSPRNRCDDDDDDDQDRDDDDQDHDQDDDSGQDNDESNLDMDQQQQPPQQQLHHNHHHHHQNQQHPSSPLRHLPAQLPPNPQSPQLQQQLQQLAAFSPAHPFHPFHPQHPLYHVMAAHHAAAMAQQHAGPNGLPPMPLPAQRAAMSPAQHGAKELEEDVDVEEHDADEDHNGSERLGPDSPGAHINNNNNNNNNHNNNYRQPKSNNNHKTTTANHNRAGDFGFIWRPFV